MTPAGRWARVKWRFFRLRSQSHDPVTGKPTPGVLSQAEEDWIRAGGGPGGAATGPNSTGPLQNKVHGQAAPNYGGTIPHP